MEQVSVFTEIDAPPAAVWSVLLDFDAYPEWNPVITAIDGDPRNGERIRVRIEPPGSRGMTLEPTIVAIEHERRLAWAGRLFFPLVFDGYHEFRLETLDDDRTQLLQRETFRGALVPILLDARRIERGFTEMNQALKGRAETQHRQTV